MPGTQNDRPGGQPVERPRPGSRGGYLSLALLACYFLIQLFLQRASIYLMLLMQLAAIGI